MGPNPLGRQSEPFALMPRRMCGGTATFDATGLCQDPPQAASPAREPASWRPRRPHACSRCALPALAAASAASSPIAKNRTNARKSSASSPSGERCRRRGRARREPKLASRARATGVASTPLRVPTPAPIEGLYAPIRVFEPWSQAVIRLWTMTVTGEPSGARCGAIQMSAQARTLACGLLHQRLRRGAGASPILQSRDSHG